METPIYKSDPTPSLEAFPAIRQAVNFLQDINNTKKKWKSLRYQEVLALVEAFINKVDPDFDTKGVSVETLVRHLNELLAQQAVLESTVPTDELQGLLRELEESEGKAKIIEQKAAQKAKEFTERVQAQIEFRKKLAPFRKAAENLTADFERKLSEGVAPEKQDTIAQAFIEELPVQAGIELSSKKISDLPPEAREIEEIKVAEKLRLSFEEAIPVVIKKLKARGVEITLEESETIARVQPTITNLPFFTQQLAKPASERQEFTAWFREQLSPAANPSEAQEISKDLIPAILGKLPELDTKALSKLSEKDFAELKGQIEEAVIAAIAEVAPELGEISPAKIPRLIASFVPQNIQELNGLASILAVAIERRTVIPTAIPPPAPPEPIVVTKLFGKGPFLFASPLKRASGGDIWQIKEKGENIVDQIRRRLYQEGLNQTNSPDFRNKTLELWASRLTTQKITPEDIDYTIDRLLKAGEKDDSPRISELKEIRKALFDFQQQYPTGFIEKIKKEGQIEGQKGNRIVQLPSSRFGQVIVRQAEFNPKYNLVTRIKSFFGEFLGKKTVIVGQNQLLSIDKLSFQTSRLFESLKAGFFRTPFGRGFQIGLQKIGQKSLQALWDTVKTGAKQIIQTGVKAILHVIGISVSAGVLNVITVVLPKLFRLGGSLVRGIGKLIISGFGILDFVLAGITGQREVQEDKTFSWLKPLLIISLAVLLFLGFFQMTVTGGAFVTPSSIRYVEPFPPEAIKPTCLNLVDIFKEKAQGQCVPAALLMAISRMEASGIWRLDCNQIAKFSTNKWWELATQEEINLGYCYDTCSRTGLCSGTTVMGPMQFEEATWKGFMLENTLMDRCRVDLSFEAAAKKIKANSETSADNCTNWDELTVRDVAYHYCGSCGTEGCRSNPDKHDSCSSACGVDYCSGVWYLYQQYATQ